VGEFGSAVYPSLLDEEKACIGSLLGYVQWLQPVYSHCTLIYLLAILFVSRWLFFP
jgi:hypothetical protein